MNKIILAKRNSAIFLATVLVAGIIALSSPSFMVGAQAVPQYGIENGYGSYEPEPEYQQQYTDREYNNYPSEYEMDSYEKKSYRNDYYEPREYPLYGKDKSKKDISNSVNINKLNCINNNVNINGNNNGTIHVGNSGKSATGSGTDEGYLGVGSVGGNGEGYDNGYKKQKDQGFTCIINNNNNNTIVTGNVTDGNETETQPCEDCILDSLSSEQEMELVEAIQFLTPYNDLEGLCEFLADETINPVIKDDTLSQILLRIGVSIDIRDDIRDCLNELGFNIFVPPWPTVSGLSNLPTIAQETEDSSALEKTTKLKQQWLELRP